MDKRTGLAIALSFLVFYGWQKYYIEPRLPKAEAAGQELSAQAVQHKTADSKVPEKTGKAIQSTVAEFEVRHLHAEKSEANIANGHFWIHSWLLPAYKSSLEKGANPVALSDVDARNEAGNIEFSAAGDSWAYLKDTIGIIKETDTAYVVKYEDDKVRWTREYAKSLASDGTLAVKVSYEFKSQPPSHVFLALRQRAPNPDKNEIERGLFAGNSEKHEKIRIHKVPNREEFVGLGSWIAIQDHYFLLAIKPEKSAPSAIVDTLASGEGRVSLSYPLSGNRFEDTVKVYFGPKEMSALKAVTPGLEHTIEFGMLSIVAYPIFKFLKWIQSYVLNWGLAIILLTIAIKILLYPLVAKSMVSMKKMAALQPEINKIKEKYSDNKEAQNRELMLFMREKGYNPLSGCLPLLLQMPIFFALYRVLSSSIELYHAPFALHIHDLSQKDPFYILPVILTAVMYLQQKMTPTSATMDPAQQKMMQFMPLIFGVFMLNLAAGLSLYMLVNTLMSIAQQMWLNRVLEGKEKTA